MFNFFLINIFYLQEIKILKSKIFTKLGLFFPNAK